MIKGVSTMIAFNSIEKHKFFHQINLAIASKELTIESPSIQPSLKNDRTVKRAMANCFWPRKENERVSKWKIRALTFKGSLRRPLETLRLRSPGRSGSLGRADISSIFGCRTGRWTHDGVKRRIRSRHPVIPLLGSLVSRPRCVMRSGLQCRDPLKTDRPKRGNAC